jgi:pimeloyl-ACP methyl ester carboxylesterase
VKIAGRFGLRDGGAGLVDLVQCPPRPVVHGLEGTQAVLGNQAAERGTRFEVPFLILHGDADLQTLPSLAEQYLAVVDAPTKEFVRLPDTGHLSMLAQPDLFLTELLTRVRPLATTPPATA